MEASGKGLLKVTGILMIIFGGISVILAIISLISAISVLALGSFLIGAAVGALLLIASIIALLSGALELVTGIVGVKNADNPAKAKTCIILCGVIILLSIISFIITCCSAFTATGLISFLLGLIIPGLYMWGAIKNQQQADQQ